MVIYGARDPGSVYLGQPTSRGDSDYREGSSHGEAARRGTSIRTPTRSSGSADSLGLRPRGLKIRATRWASQYGPNEELLRPIFVRPSEALVRWGEK